MNLLNYLLKKSVKSAILTTISCTTLRFDSLPFQKSRRRVGWGVPPDIHGLKPVATIPVVPTEPGYTV